MNVDVATEIRHRAAAAAGRVVRLEPDNVPACYANITSVEWKTAPPLRVGSQVAFVAHFLGRRLAYTYEIVELVPGERLVMRTAQGRFRWRRRTRGRAQPRGTRG